MRFWLAGALTGRDIQLFWRLFPFFIGGGMGAFWLSRHLNIIRLGEDLAHGLGQRIMLIKASCMFLIVLLCGCAVAIAGPIGFIGLAVPHIARIAGGTDYRWLLPYAAGFGALLLLCADIASRFILPGQELPVGVVTAFFGAPFLIYLAQRKERSS
jgi:iron complex transport system permease protein